MATKRLTKGQLKPCKNHNKFIVKRWKRFKVSNRSEVKERLAVIRRKSKLNRLSFDALSWTRINDYSWATNSNFSSWQMFRFADKW